MAFINFSAPGKDGQLYSVDFVVYSDQHRIANSGYHLLETTDVALADAAHTYTTAEDWLKANEALFATKTTENTDDSK